MIDIEEKMRKILYIFPIVIIILAFTACSGQGTASINPTTVKSSQDGYPSPKSPDSSYPAPVIPQNQPQKPTQTSDASMGQVQGRLSLRGKPVAGVNIYLGEVIKDSSGREIVASLNQKKDPNSLTDQDGVFNFVNIAPGRYAIIVDNVTSAFMLMDPKDQKAMLLTLQPGDKIDLGKLDYSDLPIAVP
jgi:hypothetical protein